MDQVKIDVSKPQLVEAFCNAALTLKKSLGHNLVVTKISSPGDAAFPDGTAHAGFVAVDLGGIDQTVARFQRP